MVSINFLHIAIGIVIFIAAYYAYLQLTAKTKITEEIPSLRSKPKIVTPVGLVSPTEKNWISEETFVLKTDHPSGYAPTIKKGDLIQIDDHQAMLGSTEPLLIMKDVLLEKAYTHEHLPTREYYKRKLVELFENTNTTLKKGDFPGAQRLVGEVKEAIRTVEEYPILDKEVLRHENLEDENQRLRTKLNEDRATEDGRIDRRAEPILAAIGRKLEAGQG